MPIKFLMLFDGIYLLLMVFLFPLWENEWHIYLDLSLGVLTMLTWFMVQFSDPGVIKKPEKLDFMQLLEIVDPIKLCPECFIVKTPRSFHCSTCNECVERYDHHCVWLNNCIGVKNHGKFLVFIVVLSANISSLLVTTIYNFMKLPEEIKLYDRDGNKVMKYIIFKHESIEQYAINHRIV